MVNQGLLIEKYTQHRKVHENFLKMFGTLLETALAMQCMVTDINEQYDDIFKQLAIQESPPTPKRRKAHSFDSPSTMVRPSVLDDSIDTATRSNKSDTDLSSSVLEKNINQQSDSAEESFFALTQSPSRLPLSPRRPENVANVTASKTPPRKNKNSWLKQETSTEDDKSAADFERQKYRKKSNLSLSRFSSSFKMSPETNQQLKSLPVRPKGMATPKPVKFMNPAVEQQENAVPPVGKWTVKKASGTPGRIDSTLRRTPTSSSKEPNSLLNRTRLRQTKLRFPDNLNKSMSNDDDDETYFEEFVVPSPTSTSASRFLKSAIKKEQSSLLEKSKNHPSGSKIEPQNEDEFDIDQTYCSEAEKTVARSGPAIKREPLTQKKPAPLAKKALILAKETQQQDDPSFDGSSVLFVRPSSEEEIITIEETQATRNDLFMEAIRKQRNEELYSCQSGHQEIKLEFPFENDSPPVTKSKTVPPEERRCIECSKHFRVLASRGLSVEQIRGKMPRNCRECRLVQLHETPVGFWNPEFSPTQS
ncbi:uncharacterized protein LOC129746628 [Uranotaenia lowii]|uniref:uncharacterized protein LOC129746628 n=1 Tax=Uranotaenia lowii TaxID=190385 RepID=UPI002478C979|nr:uncharacterized protein LOC129746628 [Uranotaenia lowii]